MRKKAFITLTLSILLLCHLTACSVADNLKPKPRAFEEKPFSSETWIEADAHTRGEMADNLMTYETFRPLIGKSRSELLKILGEPDTKTTGKCCYIRDTGGEVEVWLYRIESPGETGEKKMKDDAIQVFFNRESNTVMALNRGAIDEKPTHFPMIG